MRRLAVRARRAVPPAPRRAPRRRVISRRLRSVQYLRSVFGGERHWLGVASIGGAPQEASTTEDGVVHRWFLLGISLAALLQPSAAPADLVRAMLQLLEEYHYHCASSSRQNQTDIPRRPNKAIASDSADDDRGLAPSLQRANGKVVYERLLTPHVAHALDRAQVALSFCELLERAYAKLAEAASPHGPSGAAKEPAPSAALLDAILKVDGAIEEAFLQQAAKHVGAVAGGALRASLFATEPLCKRVWEGAAASDVIVD